MAARTGTDMRGNVRIVEIAVEQLANIVRLSSKTPTKWLLFATSTATFSGITAEADTM